MEGRKNATKKILRKMSLDHYPDSLLLWCLEVILQDQIQSGQLALEKNKNQNPAFGNVRLSGELLSCLPSKDEPEQGAGAPPTYMNMPRLTPSF